MSRQDLTCSMCGLKLPTLHAWGMHEGSDCPVEREQYARYAAERELLNIAATYSSAGSL